MSLVVVLRELGSFQCIEKSADLIFVRRWNATLVIGAVFGIAAGAASNFAVFGTMLAFSSFGVGGNMPVVSSFTCRLNCETYCGFSPSRMVPCSWNSFPDPTNTS